MRRVTISLKKRIIATIVVVNHFPFFVMMFSDKCDDRFAAGRREGIGEMIASTIFTAWAPSDPWRAGLYFWWWTTALNWAKLGVWSTGWQSSASIYGNGSATTALTNTTGRSRNWMNGFGVVCVCATGNSGAGRAQRSVTCWHWACR